MPKYRIDCPEGVHEGYKKLLFGIDVEEGQIKRMYIHCPDRKCGQWFEVSIKGESARLKRMPLRYHFDFNRLPVLVVDHGNK
jgi:hypothetical protein